MTQHLVGKEIFLLRLALTAPLASQPPQFLRLSLPNSRDPYLPRPFVIFRDSGNEVEVLYKIRGRFTQALAASTKGTALNLHGPLGRPFPLPAGKRALLVGGGVGAAALHPYLSATDPVKTEFLLGASCRETAWFADFFPTERSRMFTENASLGCRGSIFEVLPSILKETRPDLVLASGPLPLLRSLSGNNWSVLAQGVCQAGIPCHLIMEAMMACGEGLCRSCVITLRRAGQHIHLQVCHDGPVFPAEELCLA